MLVYFESCMNEKKLEKGFLLLFAISINTDDTPQFEIKECQKTKPIKN